MKRFTTRALCMCVPLLRQRSRCSKTGNNHNHHPLLPGDMACITMTPRSRGILCCCVLLQLRWNLVNRQQRSTASTANSNGFRMTRESGSFYKQDHVSCVSSTGRVSRVAPCPSNPGCRGTAHPQISPSARKFPRQAPQHLS